jgi:hypothetical protein
VEAISVGSVEITSWRSNFQQRAMYATAKIRQGELVFCERSIACSKTKDADAIGQAAVEAAQVSCSPQVHSSLVAYAGKYAAAVFMYKSLSTGGPQHALHAFMDAMMARQMVNSGRRREGELENVHELLGVRELVENQVLLMLGVPVSDVLNETARERVQLDVSKILTNQFLAENQGRGSAFCPFTAMINHACIPNCDYACSIQDTFGSTCAITQVFASKDIQRGEEITISYSSDLGNDRSARWLLLKATHGFPVCMCSACRQDLCITDALFAKRAVVVSCFWCGAHLQGSPLEQSEFCSQACMDNCNTKFPSAFAAVPPRKRKEAMAPLIQKICSWISSPGTVTVAFAAAVTQATTQKVADALASMLNKGISNSPRERCGVPSCLNPGTKRCSRCVCIKYCSAACQRGHWAIHKSKCSSAFMTLKAATKTLHPNINVQAQLTTNQEKESTSERKHRLLQKERKHSKAWQT